MKASFFLAILFGLILSGCRPIDDLRSRATTEMQVTFSEEGCRPLENFVPAGESIQISFSNQTEHPAMWIIFDAPFNNGFDLLSGENIYYAITADPGDTAKAEFIAPRLAARYDTACLHDSDPDSLRLNYLLVVQPYSDE